MDLGLQAYPAPQDNYHPLPDDYLAILQARKHLALTIMGKDPYPTDPIGIPFCKPTWETMRDDGTSGFHVLRSLGVDIQFAVQRYPLPTELFCALAEHHGIAFLNLSYHFLDGPCREGQHAMELVAAEEINGPICQVSNTLLLCGEANKRRWFGTPHPRSFAVVHPDVRNQISQHRDIRAKWVKWWTPNAVAAMFALNLTPIDQ